MDTSFFPRTWRGKKVKSTEKEKNLPIGQYDLIRIERKFENVVSEFIKNIFNYEKISVVLIKREPQKLNRTKYFNGELIPENGHAKYKFASQIFNNQFYEFTISNIPATIESRHIQIFFRVLMQYFEYFSESILNSLPIENGILKASPSFVAKSEIWLYNLERTIIIEYIYNLFNTFNEDYSNEFKLAPSPNRYDIDLVTNIVDFAYELSTKKVENKEIYCGFIFHDKMNDINANSVRSIKFKKQFDFGDFGQLKNYLEISNGQNVFFNVTKDKISHLFITREKVNEIYLNPMSSGKQFQKRPLILSIQGNGKIYFLEGRSEQNKMILQIINSKPVIRDNNFIQNFIFESLKSFATVDDEQIEIFSKWVMSLSQKKHGTSLIFLEVLESIEKKLVKTIPVEFGNNNFLNPNNLRHDLTLLESIVNPDGAVVFGKNLIPSNISTILPIGKSSQGTSGGARHNSVLNFTKQFNCLGIVISEDGPITIFENGNKKIKF
ncbi:MAG: DNA integrity scanning protein DisA nucleotide-binding domain protein [bacterium]